MFENPIKKQFMAANISNTNVIKALGKYEKEYGKDLATFNKEEIKNMFKDMKAKSATLYNRKSVLTDYTNLYTRKHGGVNYYATIRPDEIQNLTYHKSYYTLDDVDDVASGFKNACDKAIIYLVFFGLSTEEIYEISKRNIDREHQQIIVNNRSVKIPRYVLNYVSEACETYVYYNENPEMYATYFPLRKDVKTVLKPRAESKGDPQKTIGNRIRNRFSTFKARIDNPEFGKVFIFDSGIVYFINQLMMDENLTVDEVFLEENFKPIRERFNLMSPASSYKIKFRGAF